MIDPLPEPERPQRPNWHVCPLVTKAHLSALERVVEMAEGEDYPGHKHEFGVLYVGGGKYWPGVAIGCRMLRKLGYNGPIQIWHRHFSDPEHINLEDIQGLDIEVIDAIAVSLQTKPRILRGWEAKLHAIRHCSFRKLLFLDADAYCVNNPMPYFDILDKTPFAFWHDLPGTERNVNWPYVWPQGANGVPPIQGGHLWIDREKAWPLIMTADWMCQHSDFYFKHGFGDQDTWRIALAAGGWPYQDIGPARWFYPAFLCRLNGIDLIVHRCQGKLGRIKDAAQNHGFAFGPAYHLPREVEVQNELAFILRKDTDPYFIFDAIYRRNVWGNNSSPNNVTLKEDDSIYISIISGLISMHNWTSILDAGCGDGKVTELITASNRVKTTAIDCVARILPTNSNIINYQLGDITKVEELPSADVILAKDVLHHWPYAMISDWLSRIIQSKKWKWIVLTQDRFQRDHDTYLGGYRALDPRKPPLSEFGPWDSIIPYLHKAICVKRCYTE